MERDRGLSLLRQAFVEGNLRPEEADTFDPRWWRKVKWTIDWLAGRNMNEVRKLRHALNCGLIDYFAGEKALDLHWEQAVEIQNLVQKDLMPWRAAMDAKVSRKKIHEMIETWKSIYGDPDDPEVSERIQKTADHLMSQAAKAL